MIDRDAVTVVLNAALLSYERFEFSPTPEWQGFPNRPFIKLSSPALAHFTAVLKAQPDLAIFDGRTQEVGGAGHGIGVSLHHLATWLVERAIDVGTDQAVADLSQYVDGHHFPVTEAVALAGVIPEHDADLGDGIRLVSISEVPSCIQRDMLVERQADPLAALHTPPSAALLCETRWPVNHSEMISFAASNDTSRLAELEDARRVITLVGPCSPVNVVSWQIVPASVPLANRALTWSMQIDSGYPGTPVRRLTSEDLRRVQELRRMFASAKPKDKDHLRVALDRLNRSLRRVPPVDRAIDLGICLEALFLNDRAKRFRLRRRASRYLATDAKERERISDAMEVLYGLRSDAVHTGRLDLDKEGVPVSTWLEYGTDLAATTLRKMIREGVPDWRKVNI